MSLAKKDHIKTVFIYGLISLFILLFTLIYEQFSHGVTSLLMRLSFLFPLVGGSILHLCFYIIPKPHEKIISIWNMSLSTWVSGFILHGIFEIYGTEKRIVFVFFWVAGFLSLLSIVLYSYTFIKKLRGESST